MTSNNPTQSPSADEQLVYAHIIYQKLLAEQQSAMLATVNDDGSPLASYAPFAMDADRNFYLLISTLSSRTINLVSSGEVSLMLITDETQSSQVFARERATFYCKALTLARDSTDWQAAAKLYKARFGDIFDLLQGFRDFHMVRLTPQRGWLVVGFGQAYEISGRTLDVLTHRNRP